MHRNRASTTGARTNRAQTNLLQTNSVQTEGRRTPVHPRSHGDAAPRVSPPLPAASLVIVPSVTCPSRPARNRPPAPAIR